MELYELRQKQSIPLEGKIVMSKQRIREWYEHWDGQVAVSFSGGLDSTALLHLVREDYPDVPAFFVNTHLEFPAIVRFVNQTENVTVVVPKMSFQEIVQKYGYPVVSKDIARSVYYARKGSAWALRRFDGINKDGSHSEWYSTRQAKYKFLLDAPFNISDECCNFMKKKPLYEIEKHHHMFTGMRTEESDRRETAWLLNGCNAFNAKRPKSMPLAFWLGQDVLHYIRDNGIPYASDIYGDIVEDDNGKLKTTLEERTGCYCCLFGQSARRLKGKETRYERLKRLYPSCWEYALRPLDRGGAWNGACPPVSWHPLREGGCST